MSYNIIYIISIFNKDYGRAVDVYEPYARTKGGGKRVVGEAVAIDKTTSS